MRHSVTAALAAAAIVTGGCAMIEKMQAVDTERLLAASGFRMKLADTPEKLAMLQAIPQRKLVPYKRDGQLLYVYADALSCKCIYVGDEAAYQRYQQLVVQQRMENMRLETAAMERDAAMDWNMWGPWGPWGP